MVSTRIRRSLAAAAIAAVAVSVVGVGAQAQADTPRAGCAPTAVFETDGYGSGQTLANWNNSGFNHAPPAGWEIVQVQYYAGVFPVVDQKALDDSVVEGTANLTKAVTDYHAACPGAQLVLTGYSEGAVVAGDVLEQFSQNDAIPHGQLNGVLYGNPRRDFGDGGIGGIAGGIETNVPTILPGVTMKGGQHYGDIAVQNVCNENDGICNSANMITNLAAFANGLMGYAQGDHGYDLNPARDLGNGLIFHPQPQRIGFGPPLPLPIGTPWQLQQQAGGNAGQNELRMARSALVGLLGQPVIDQLTANSPWFKMIASA